MAYIRSRREERTGYQERRELIPSVDFQCDFVMVYGTDGTMPQRVRQFQDAGYAVHLMTGISWGDYQDYLDGGYEARSSLFKAGVAEAVADGCLSLLKSLREQEAENRE